MKLFKQLLALILVIAIFIGINGAAYLFMTQKLSANYGEITQIKMIDLAKYLPFEETSELARINSSFKLNEGDDLPVLDGASALVPIYASVIDSVYPKGCVTYEGGVFSDDNYYGENFSEDSAMQYKNTVRGYTAIVDGETDILFCAAPSAEQRKYAEEQGVELVYVPIGLEAFVFFVNNENPVDDLTADEIRDIYAGEIKNWNKVGGPNRVINPVSRIEGSGSQTMMEKFMGEREIGKKSLFAFTGASIGFSFRYYLDGMIGNDGVKMLSLGGVYPSEENIKNGTYPIVAEFYAIYRADNDNPNIKPLIDWLLSEEGQELIKECGYVGIK